MGLAIPVMHYTGMAAASFTPSPAIPDLAGAVSISALGTMGIIGVTFMVLGLAVITSAVDRHFAAQVRREDAMLRESEARLREAAERRDFILKAAGIGTWEHDLISDAIEWSNTMEAIHGLPPAAFPEHFDAFIDIVHPEDRARVRQNFQRFLEDGDETAKQFRVVWPDGSGTLA